jgi:DNA replication protein DnaC
MPMDQQLLDQLAALELPHLRENWDTVVRDATRAKPSYHRFLSEVIGAECRARQEHLRLARMKRARIAEPLVMETFPFTRQPKLDRRKILDLYDSLRFITESQILLFIGPTGCGKTGLATAFLIHAINNERRGRFIDFKDLSARLYQSLADHSDRGVIKHFAAWDCLFIDELGYTPLDKRLAGLFFDLIKQRHRKRCTIITTQLGLSEWPALLGDQHLSAALIDRITENCTVFNMSACVSIRQKKIAHVTKSAEDA